MANGRAVTSTVLHLALISGQTVKCIFILGDLVLGQESLWDKV